MTPQARIRTLITQAEDWRARHVAAGHGIDAAACAIRISALRDALAVVEASIAALRPKDREDGAREAKKEPTSKEFQCIIEILNDVADNGSYTNFEPDDRYRSNHRAMMKILDSLGFMGENYRQEIYDELVANTQSRRVAAAIDLAKPEFRIGRKVSRNVYRGDTPMFMATTEEEAAEMVALMNVGRAALAKQEGTDAE